MGSPFSASVTATQPWPPSSKAANASDSMASAVTLGPDVTSSTVLTGASRFGSIGVTRRRLMPRSAPMNSRTNSFAGRLSSSAGVANCSSTPCSDSTTIAVGQPYGLVQVMRHEHDRLADGALQPEELVLEPDAHDRVDGRERLVHQQGGRIGGERSGHADALVLPAGQLTWVAVAVSLRVQADELQQLLDARAGALLRPAEQSRHGGDVRRDRLVGKQPDVLDDVPDFAPQFHCVGRP